MRLTNTSGRCARPGAPAPHGATTLRLSTARREDQRELTPARASFLPCCSASHRGKVDVATAWSTNRRLARQPVIAATVNAGRHQDELDRDCRRARRVEEEYVSIEDLGRSFASAQRRDHGSAQPKPGRFDGGGEAIGLQVGVRES